MLGEYCYKAYGLPVHHSEKKHSMAFRLIVHILHAKLIEVVTIRRVSYTILSWGGGWGGEGGTTGW